MSTWHSQSCAHAAIGLAFAITMALLFLSLQLDLRHLPRCNYNYSYKLFRDAVRRGRALLEGVRSRLGGSFVSARASMATIQKVFLEDKQRALNSLSQDKSVFPMFKLIAVFQDEASRSKLSNSRLQPMHLSKCTSAQVVSSVAVAPSVPSGNEENVH